MIKYFTLNTITEGICFIIAFYCLKSDNSPAWRRMIWFILITTVTEMIGVHIKRLYLADRVHVHSNVWLYNILLILQAGFISTMFSALFSKYINSGRLILGGIGVLAILWICETLNHGIFEYNNTTNTVMSVLFVFYCYYYYYLFLKDNDHLNLWRSADFWWIGGALLFYFGRTACNVLFDVISLLRPDVEVTSPIYKVLNVIFYSLWSYSFICRKWHSSISRVQFQ